MTEHEISRTLVKSPPELWAECSDASSLARHLEQFGEIRVTGLEPETAVAWEGEHASGSVRLEPSGWGTKVILTARSRQQSAETEEPAPEPGPQPAPLPPAAAQPSPARPGLLARLLQRFKAPPAREPAPPPPPTPVQVAPEPASPPEPEPAAATDPAEVLTAALDSLGQAHHRPFSRA